MNLRAFTLIELLVVIAIIATLAAILFPVFAQAREKAVIGENIKQTLSCIVSGDVDAGIVNGPLLRACSVPKRRSASGRQDGQR